MNKLKSIFHKNRKHSDHNDHTTTLGHDFHDHESHETRKKFEQLSLSEGTNVNNPEDNDCTSINDSDISSREVTPPPPSEQQLNENNDNESLSCSSSSCLSSFNSESEEEAKTPVDIPMFTEQTELIDYQLITKIGEGAFSKVFKGINIKTGDEFAVKVIKKQTLNMTQEDKHTKSTTKLEQVLKEVTLHKMITSLQCPNIVKFIEFKESSSFYYIIQELLTGGEIFNTIVKYTYFSEDLSRHVIKQLGNAVRALHSMGIVHRDIKPENLLFEPIEYIANDHPKLRKSDDPMTKMDEGLFQPNIGGGGIGIVKLTDFGLSKQIYQTNTKTPCGTVGYTAPEVVKDEKYSMKVDMWGVGCVLYTMLCGFPPFYDDKIDILTEKISRGEYTFLSPWWDEISIGAKTCVARLLEVDPEKRYTIDEFMADSWLNKFDSKPKIRSSKTHHERVKDIKNSLLYQNLVDPSLLYSPAAVAMRDAFDISNAVKRNQTVPNNNNNTNNKRKGLYSLEEEEDKNINDNEYIDDTNKFNNEINENGNNLFELNLKTSTIIQRRQKKQRMASPLTTIPMKL